MKSDEKQIGRDNLKKISIRGDQRHTCSKCQLLVDSEESLKVHMQYQHDSMSRWGVPTAMQSVTCISATSTTLTTLTSGASESSHSGPSVSNNITTLTNSSSKSSSESNDNNGQQKNKHSQQQVSRMQGGSAVTNNTVSAAADSSNNQSPTPASNGTEQGSHSFSVSSFPNHSSNHVPQEAHGYPYIVHGYDQYYGHHTPIESSMYSVPYQPGSNDYKSLSHHRYHPYQNIPQLAQQSSINGNTASITTSNNSLSPRVVSSSSPSQNSTLGHSAAHESSGLTNIAAQGQPTPSPSPKQCDKCGYVCHTDTQLNEHYTSSHGISENESASRTASNGDEVALHGQYNFSSYIKEEHSSDILDLDSQKMVYPPAHDPVSHENISPAHSIHQVPRHMWSTDVHGSYVTPSQNEVKQPYYVPMRPTYGHIKQDYQSISKQDYPAPNTFGATLIKQEYNTQIMPQTRSDIKPFNTDLPTGNNPTTSSPSEFPSTTTPQDNSNQFRGFEPPTSSLQNSAPSTKSTTWKSNEARRPKTYNCTACNKWFTSSGHLKRHYNTTLHKNAVKSSGQPDPATMPISAHHHPSRDPNSKHNRNHQSQQPPPAPPEPPRSPEYTPQFTPPPGGFGQPPISFSQFNPATPSNLPGGHPNVMADPSGPHSSQQRGLPVLKQEQGQQVLREGSYQILHPIPEHHQITISVPHTSPNQSMVMHHNQINSTEPFTSPTSTNQVIMPLFRRMLPEESAATSHRITGNDSIVINSEDLGVTSLICHDSNQLMYDPPDVGQPLPMFRQLQPRHSNIAVYSVPERKPQSPLAADMAPQSSNRAKHNTKRLQHYGSDTVVFKVENQQSVILRDTNLIISNFDDAGNCFGSYIAVGEGDNYGATTMKTTVSNIPATANCSANGNRLATVTNDSSSIPSSLSPTPSTDSVASAFSSGSAPSSASVSSSVSCVPPARVECTQCKKDFAKMCYLTQHNKSFHSGDHPFRCPKCGKRYQEKIAFNLHVDKHKAKDKPFKCDQCPKQFHHKTDLRRHKDAHNGKRAHVCGICNKGFCRKDHLHKHLDTHKPKMKKVLPKKKEEAKSIGLI